jgi:hypothetical protein
MGLTQGALVQALRDQGRHPRGRDELRVAEQLLSTPRHGSRGGTEFSVSRWSAMFLAHTGFVAPSIPACRA